MSSYPPGQEPQLAPLAHMVGGLATCGDPDCQLEMCNSPRIIPTSTSGSIPTDQISNISANYNFASAHGGLPVPSSIQLPSASPMYSFDNPQPMEGVWVYPTSADLVPYTHIAPKPGKTEFEDQGWMMSEGDQDDIYFDPTGGCSEVSHYCESFGWRFFTGGADLLVLGVCAHCSEPIPDSIITLWKLKHADVISTINDLCGEADFLGIGDFS